MQSVRIVLHFPKRLVDQPVIYELVKRFGLEFNILKALITPNEEGLMVLAIRGDEDACGRAVDYLHELGVRTQPLTQDIVRDEDRCTHCGVCVSVCAPHALAIERDTMMVRFDKDLCTACELCIRTCPSRAIAVNY